MVQRLTAFCQYNSSLLHGYFGTNQVAPSGPFSDQGSISEQGFSNPGKSAGATSLIGEQEIARQERRQRGRTGFAMGPGERREVLRSAVEPGPDDGDEFRQPGA